MRRYSKEDEFEEDELKSSEDGEEQEGEKPVYECPLCGVEVDEEGYCDECHENTELEDDY